MYFSQIYFSPYVIVKLWKKEKDFSFTGHLPPHQPSPQREASPAPAPLSPAIDNGPRHPLGPTGQPPLSLLRPTCWNPLPQIPPPLLRALAPAGNFLTIAPRPIALVLAAAAPEPAPPACTPSWLPCPVQHRAVASPRLCPAAPACTVPLLRCYVTGMPRTSRSPPS
jgi:hypothetical protein